jgi:hypothetical protein
MLTWTNPVFICASGAELGTVVNDSPFLLESKTIHVSHQLQLHAPKIHCLKSQFLTISSGKN